MKRLFILSIIASIIALPASARRNNALAYATPESVGMDGTYLNHTIDSIANASIAERCFPGCQILVARKGKIVFHKSYGHHTYECNQPVENSHLYDMASCTKAMAATIALMRVVEQKKIDLDKPYSTYFNEFIGSNKEEVTLREYLAHQGGARDIGYGQIIFEKGRKLRSDLFSNVQSEDFPHAFTDSLYVSKQVHARVFDMITNRKNRKKKYYYACLMFHTFPTVIERVTGRNYEDFLREEFYEPLGAKEATYNPRKKYPLSQIVPTESGDKYRKDVHGFVHDPTAAVLGGVSGNAGLFANSESLAPILQMLLNKGKYDGKRYFKRKTVREWTSCQYPENGNHRALGFDRRRLNDTLPLEKRLSGAYYYAPSVSEKGFGHSGFTGTMVWADPEEDLVFVFLSNRVHPTSANRVFAKCNPRSKCHEAAYEAIRRYRRR